MNSDQKDYYEILGIAAGVSQQEIRDAYRKLAFRFHPDRNKDDPAASERMKALNEAYATLSDPNKRAEYDSFRQRYGSMAYQQYRQTHSAEDIFRGSDIEQIFQEFARSFGFRDADEIFKEFYGQGFRSYEYRRPGFVYRRYVFRPGQRGQRSQQSRIDDQQGQMGQQPPPLIAAQPGCAGGLIRFILKTVFRIQVPERGKDMVDVLRVTPEMARTGGEIEYNYRKWGKPKDLLVRVPPGVTDGQTIRLSGMGYEGKAGGPQGDLLLKVTTSPSLGQRIRSIFGK